MVHPCNGMSLSMDLHIHINSTDESQKHHIELRKPHSEDCMYMILVTGHSEKGQTLGYSILFHNTFSINLYLSLSLFSTTI